MAIHRSLSLVLIFGLLVVASPGSSAQSELDQARQNAAQATEHAENARDLAAEAELEVLESVGAIEAANAQLVVVELAAVDLTRRADQLLLEREELVETVQVYALQSYVSQESAGAVFLASGNPTDGAKLQMYIDLISGASLEDIDRYRVLTQDLQNTRSAHEELVVSQLAFLDALEAENAAMARALGVAQAQIREAEAAEAEFLTEVAKLEEVERLRLLEERRKAEQERLRKEKERREKLEEEKRRAEAKRQAEAERRQQNEDQTTSTTIQRPPVIIGDGTLLCPIAGLTHFSDTWGAARSGGRRHQGVDMFAERGTPVVAVVGGTLRLSSSRLGGNGFWLSGDDGNTYFGSHLDSLVGISGRIEAGVVLGTVGNTGNARFTAPHLHFEVRPGGGSPVNPYPTAASACGK